MVRVGVADVSLFAGILAAVFHTPYYLLGFVWITLRHSVEYTDISWLFRLDAVSNAGSLISYAMAGIFGGLAIVFDKEWRSKKGGWLGSTGGASGVWRR